MYRMCVIAAGCSSGHSLRIAAVATSQSTSIPDACPTRIVPPASDICSDVTASSEGAAWVALAAGRRPAMNDDVSVDDSDDAIEDDRELEAGAVAAPACARVSS